MVQHSRNRDALVVGKIKQDVWHGRWPTAQARGEFVARAADFWLHQQCARVSLDLVEQSVGGDDTVLGNVQPRFQQIVFRTGGMANPSHSVTLPIAVLPALLGLVA